MVALLPCTQKARVRFSHSPPNYLSVAQSGSVLDLDSRGRRFKSYRVDQFKGKVMRIYENITERISITVEEGLPHQYWCSKHLTIQLSNNQFVKLNASQIKYLSAVLAEEDLTTDALGR